MPTDLLSPLAIPLSETAALIASSETRPKKFRAKVQILRQGQFDFGTFQSNIVMVDQDLMEKLAANHLAGARGRNTDGTPADLPVDIDHETRDAAGWITGLTVEDGRLMADITWNALGVTLLTEDRFRFMSVMFSEAYKDPEGKTWGTTLWGAAVTNYPRIKDMAALTLSAREVGREPRPEPVKTPDPTEGTDMDPKLLAKALGLDESATEEQIMSAAATLKAAADTTPDDSVTVAQAAEITGLKASVKTLETKLTANGAELAQLKADEVIEKHKASGKLTDAHLVAEDGTPTDLAKMATANPEGFDAMVAKFPVVVEFGTRGSAGGGTPTEGPAGVLEAAIQEKMTAGPMDHTAAVRALEAEKPELFAAVYGV
tara:strand:- start:6451 stop:7572 length:1122 start_codon:yes stop_codon:yes gene_type:complete